MTKPETPVSRVDPGCDPEAPSRWELIRDLAVFQLKLAVDALRDVALIPVSLVTGFIDLLTGGDRPGRMFYDVLHLGRRSEAWINLFGEVDRIDPPQLTSGGAPTVDSLIARVEGLIVEQFERGGMTAAAKDAIDRSLDAFAPKPNALESADRQRRRVNPPRT